MKNLSSSVKKTLIAKYLEEDKPSKNSKSTDINVLLNRVKLNQKMNIEKNIFFSSSFYWIAHFWNINFLKLINLFSKSIVKLIGYSYKGCALTQLF